MKVSRLLALFGLLGLVFALNAYAPVAVFADHGGTHSTPMSDEDRDSSGTDDDDDSLSSISPALPLHAMATGGAAGSIGICQPDGCTQHGAELFWGANTFGAEFATGGASGSIQAAGICQPDGCTQHGAELFWGANTFGADFATGGATGSIQAAGSFSLCVPGTCNQHGAEIFWAAGGVDAMNGNESATGGASASLPISSTDDGFYSDGVVKMTIFEPAN